MKKIKSLTLITCMLVLTSALPVSAKTDSNSEPSVIQIEREDVSLEEALQDPTFDINHAGENEIIMPRSTYWKVWGDTQYRSSDNTMRPLGFSEHKSGNTTLNTYHYTRTYLDGGILGGKKGDSGRVWGYGTVQATGEYCMMDVWDNCVHTVKYGTED